MNPLGSRKRPTLLLSLGLALSGLVGCGGGSGGGGIATSGSTISGSFATVPGVASPLVVGGATQGVGPSTFQVFLELSNGTRFPAIVNPVTRTYSVTTLNAVGLGARIVVEYGGRIVYEDPLGPLTTGTIMRPVAGPSSTLAALLARIYLGNAGGAAGLASLALPGGGTLDLDALRDQIDQNPGDPLIAALTSYLTRIALGTAQCSLTQIAAGTCGDTALGSLIADLQAKAAATPPPTTTGGAGASGPATLVSVGIGGSGQGGGLAYPQPSTTGQFLVWASFNDGDLVPGDTNGKGDCFVRDVTGMTTERVSVATAGQADGDCRGHSISGDGSKVTYSSDATNAVAAPAAGGNRQAYLYDRGTMMTTMLSQVGGTAGDDASYNTRISQDGAYGCFISDATNLGVAAAGPKVFRVNIGTGVLEHASSLMAGSFVTLGECDISGDGSKISFDGQTVAMGDTKGYVFDFGAVTPTSTVISDIGVPPPGPLGNFRVRISDDGNFVCWAARQPLVPADTDTDDDIYVRNLMTNALEHVSVDSTGANVSGFAADCSINQDGSKVSFTANRPYVPEVTANVNHVYVRDRGATTTKLVVGPFTSIGNDSSSISPDGSKIVYATGEQLVPEDSPAPFHFDAYVSPVP